MRSTLKRTVQESKIYNQAYYAANIDKIKAREKTYRDNLTKGYIARLLHIQIAALSPEMEEQKRMQIRLTRGIIQVNKQINKTIKL